MGDNQTSIDQAKAKKIVDAFITSEANQNKETRAAQFKKYQSFVLDGLQWNAYEQKNGDEAEITFNKSEDYVDIYLSKLFPRNPETGAMQIGVKSLAKSKADKEKYEREIFKVYQENKLHQTLLEQGQNFFVGGDACLYYPEDEITNTAKIISLDPTSILLGWNGRGLEEFAFCDEISLADAESLRSDSWLARTLRTILSKNGEASKKFKKEKRYTYWNNEVQIIKVGDFFDIRTNKSGIIPFSWIPNKPKAHMHEGRSEVKGLWTMEREANFRMSDFGERVRKNTKSVLATYSKLNANKLEENKIEGLLAMDQDDKAEFLKLDENKEVLEYISTLSDKMDRKMAINDAVNGIIKSNVSSLAMMYYFSPLLDRIALKRVYWDEAFRELNRAILTYKFKTGEFETQPVYQPVMAVDQETKIKTTILMLQNRLISFADAIDALRGSENSIEKFAEIKSEYEELSKIKGFLQIKNETQTQAQ